MAESRSGESNTEGSSPEKSSPEESSPSAPRKPITRTQRTLIEAGIFLLVIFLLGWGTDALARSGAEALLARNIQDATGVSERPVVTVRGFAFVPQVIRGSYARVEVSTIGIRNGPLRIDRIDSELRDVRVPFHDVLVQNVRRVGIGSSSETVSLRYTDINAYFETTGRPLRLGPAPNGETRVTGEVDALNTRVKVDTLVSFSVADKTLKINPREVNTGSSGLSKATRLLLGQRLSLAVPLGTLPFGQDLIDAKPYADGIKLRAQGNAVILAP